MGSGAAGVLTSCFIAAGMDIRLLVDSGMAQSTNSPKKNQPTKTEKAPSPDVRDWSLLKNRGAKSALRFGVGALFARNQHLTAVVQVAFHHVGMVKKVLFAGCLTDRDVRSFRFVVRAAGALTALGMPPFRIWHDLLFFCGGWTVEGSGFFNKTFCLPL